MSKKLSGRRSRAKAADAVRSDQRSDPKPKSKIARKLAKLTPPNSDTGVSPVSSANDSGVSSDSAFLNKTCFNPDIGCRGGEFNVPIGTHNNPALYDRGSESLEK